MTNAEKYKDKIRKGINQVMDPSCALFAIRIGANLKNGNWKKKCDRLYKFPNGGNYFCGRCADESFRWLMSEAEE